jgi:thioredoxin reductase (NADPH)
LIFGTGPSGIQAAIHSARNKAKVAKFGKVKMSWLASAHFENYCCMNGKMNGLAFLNDGVKQARRFGTEIFDEDVLKIDRRDNKFYIETEEGNQFLGTAIIIATGVRKNKLGIKGESEFLGKGVSYCVECDANFFKGKTVAVVGDGSAAASGALLLMYYGNEIYLICNKLNVKDRFEEQVRRSGINILERNGIREIQGKEKVEQIVLKDGRDLKVEGVFIELGSKGAVELLSNLGVVLDDSGFIKTNKKQETNITGIFAAGDVCGPPFQVAKAVGEGCIAGLNASNYAKNIE